MDTTRFKISVSFPLIEISLIRSSPICSFKILKWLSEYSSSYSILKASSLSLSLWPIMEPGSPGYSSEIPTPSDKKITLSNTIPYSFKSLICYSFWGKLTNIFP